MVRANHPEKIAILGGGLGALATAFELTSSPDWQSRYAITVYQQGFRLGGKCASSRRAEPTIASRSTGSTCGWASTRMRSA